MSNTLRFVIYGVAQPQGSTRGFVPKGWKRAVITSDNPQNKGWRQLVAEGASRALAESGVGLIDTPVHLSVAFYLPRPKSLPKRVAAHVKRPDLDKLLRSVGDALTRVVWADDAQLVKITGAKDYAPPHVPPHAVITVESIRLCVQ
jgi:Holliday junction resolvase RusA-like endonuclease